MELAELKTENDRQHAEIKASISDIDTKQDTLSQALSGLIGKMDTTKMIIIYVVVPLIVILGGLVGIKIAFPTAL
jgi:hypothetical protein